MQTRKAGVFRNGRSQAVRIPAEYRFNSDEVFIFRDPQSGVVSLYETPFRATIEAIFDEFDAAGAADFFIERDRSLPSDRDIL